MRSILISKTSSKGSFPQIDQTGYINLEIGCWVLDEVIILLIIDNQRLIIIYWQITWAYPGMITQDETKDVIWKSFYYFK